MTSRLSIDGLEVIFPFPSVYPEQIAYMTQMKLSLDAGGPCVLEMPSGTGKTVCILSLVIAYMSQNPNVGPLIYCTRTIPELEQGISELKRVHRARAAELGLDYDRRFLGVAVSCRANLCVFPEVSDHRSKADVDIECRSRNVAWSDMHCPYYDHVLLRPRPGVYGLSDLKNFGVVNGLCPYWLCRHLVQEAEVIMGSFAYLLDPLASDVVVPHVPETAITVFDEAHNIDDVCCEFMSAWVDGGMLDRSFVALDAIQSVADEMHKCEQGRLERVFQRLKEDLEATIGPDTQDLFDSPTLPEHILRAAMPVSLQSFTYFLGASRQLLKFFAAFIQGQLDFQRSTRFTVPEVLAEIYTICDLEVLDLQCMQRRFGQFLRRYKVVELKKFAPLNEVLMFGGMLASHDEGYCVFVEGTADGPIIQLACLDSSLAFNTCLSHFKRVVVTSGTLSPLAIYPRLLNFEPTAMVDFTMSLSRRCLLPLIVTKGNDHVPLSSSYKLRDDSRVPKNYGDLLLKFCQMVPDGVVCFFPSYVYLQLVFKSWWDDGTIAQIMKSKLFFLETEIADETSIALENYRKAIECGRGAVFLGVARGRVSEGIDFADHYGRCVLLFGLPVRNTISMLVQTRAEFVESKYGVEKNDFILFDAMRAACQCVGRLLRSKNDYGIVVMADRRYARPKAYSQLPHWIKQFVTPGRIGVTIDEATEQTRHFLVQMAQPFKHDPNKLLDMDKL
jgi:DNA excision repair protein ERCC-2